MNAKQILLISNPVSGRGPRAVRTDVGSELQLAGHRVFAYETTADPAHNQNVYATAHRYDAVVCCGGDGTLNAVVNGLRESGCSTPVLYIPTGTTNDLAKSLRLPHTVTESLAPLEDSVSRPIDIGLFNGRRYFTYIASMGAFTDVSYTTPQELKNWLGHTAYVWQGLTNLPRELRSIRAKVTTGRDVIEDEFLFCSISNSTSIGGVLTLNSDDVAFDDGLFEVMLIHRPKNVQQLWNMVRALQSKSYLAGEASGIDFFHTSQVHIETEDEAAWTLDGERGGRHKNVRVDVMRGGMNLLIA